MRIRARAVPGRSIPVFILTALFLHLSCVTLLASDGPEWISKRKPDDLYRYYVGQTREAEITEASTQAYKDAMSQAIKENFGAETQIEEQSLESSQDVKYSKRFTEKTQPVVVKDFELIEQFRKDGVLYVLFRYRISSIEAEKRRLRDKSQSEKEASRYTANTAQSQKGGVEIRTNPDDINVFVDDLPWGKTNLVLSNKLNPGIHTLRLEHQYYNTIFEQFIVAPNDNTKINKFMTRAEGIIRVSTTPVTGADVTVDGRTIGRSPIEYPVPAGLDHEITVDHREAERLTTHTMVSKNETRDIRVSLVLKPAFISISTIPAGADVSINWREAEKASLVDKSVTPREELTVRVSMPGYQDRTLSVTGLQGGETRVLPPVELVPLNYAEQNAQEKDRKGQALKRGAAPSDDIRPWGVNFGVAYYTDLFKDYDTGAGGFYVKLEKRFIPSMGVSFGTYIIPRPQNDGDEDEDRIWGQELNAALSYYLGKMFAIRPEIGRFQGTLSRQNESWSASSYYYGISAGLAPASTSKGFLELLVGVRQYSNDKELQGNTSMGIHFGGELLF